jgi:hypothetical protein
MSQLKVKQQSWISAFKQFSKAFFPMSFSDIVMALGDPMILMVLATLPNGPQHLAAYAIGKSIAVFFESPVISVLPAANALAVQANSRTALLKFVFLLGGILSAGLLLLGALLALLVKLQWFVEPHWQQTAWMLLALFAWPGLIALRRFWQGQIIRVGNTRTIAYGSLIRLLLMGITLWYMSLISQQGGIIAAMALLAGVVTELIYIRVKASKLHIPEQPKPALPETCTHIALYYWPLAKGMISFWGARLCLPLLIAMVSLNDIAAWSVAWAWVIAVSNGVRMLQQLIIRYQGTDLAVYLTAFTLVIGFGFSSFLALFALTPIGDQLLEYYGLNDLELITSIRSVMIASIALPLLMAIQNRLQGFLMFESRTCRIGHAAFNANLILVLGTLVATYNQWPAFAFALIVNLACCIEIGILLQKPHTKVIPYLSNEPR